MHQQTENKNLCEMKCELFIGFLLLAWLAGDAVGQTPFCGAFPGVCGSISGGYCCECVSGVAAPYFSTTNSGGPNDCECAPGCATNNVTGAAVPASWTATQPASKTVVGLYALSATGLQDVIFGPDNYFLRFSVYAFGSTTPSTFDSPQQYGNPTWNAGAVWPANYWTYFTVQILDQDGGTSVQLSPPVAYQLSTTPLVATGLYTDTIGTNAMPTITVTANNGGTATFAMVSAPTDCTAAGATNAGECSRFCNYVNSHTSVSGTFATTASQTSCTCDGSAQIAGTAGPSFACTSTTGGGGGGTAATTSTPATTTSSSSTAAGVVVSSSVSVIVQDATNGSSGTSDAVIAGAVVGVVVGVALIGAAAVFVFRRHALLRGGRSHSTVMPMLENGGSHA